MKHTCHMSMVARDWNGADNESTCVQVYTVTHTYRLKQFKTRF